MALSQLEIVIPLHFDTVRALVTSNPNIVSQWISEIEFVHRNRLDRLIVGLDIEWRPYFFPEPPNPIAILQLCVGRRCLIFQFRYAPFYYIPYSLRRFLQNERYTFVGVGVREDVAKLVQEHGLRVENAVEIGPIAAEQYDNNRWRNAGLRALTRRVLGVVIEKPLEVTLSPWDNPILSLAQIRYAVTDAFVSFEMGRVLHAWLYC